MICITWVAVFQIYDSAAGKTVFRKDVVHDAVVGVCVDADDMVAFLMCMVLIYSSSTIFSSHSLSVSSNVASSLLSMSNTA